MIMKTRRRLVTLSFVLFCFCWLITPSYAQLSKQAKADTIQQEIEQRVEEQNVVKADELFKEYIALGFEMPTALKLVRAQVSAKLGDFIEAKRYLEQYINTTDRGSEKYQEALSMHATIESEAAAQLADIRQKEASRNRGQAQTDRFSRTGGLELLPEMLVIPAGSFQMGSDESEPSDEKPTHSVQVASFKMSKFETSQALWVALMVDNPSRFKGDDRPVESVSWSSAQEFIKRLNDATGKQYRLPSEAEWEYGASAGSNRKYSWGDSASKEKANYDNSIGQTTSSGSYEPNQFGLYDMHGNVWEWVQDCYHSNYLDAPNDGSVRTDCDSDYRVLRGGSWFHGSDNLRSAFRYGDAPDYRFTTFGFRLAEDN